MIGYISDPINGIHWIGAEMYVTIHPLDETHLDAVRGLI